MKTTAILSIVLIGCAVPKTEQAECSSDAPADIHGEIVEGKEVPLGTTVVVPHKVAVLVHTEIPIVEVRVGGVPARLSSVAEQRWEAQLFTNDLEEHRENDVANMEVVALDRCGHTYTLDSASIALGPAPGIAVKDLVVTESHTPAECYVPSGGSNASLLDVAAQLASTGAKVTLHASGGAFDNGTATREVTLTNGGTDARASTFYVPGTAGTATITAIANGATATPISLLVVDPPAFTGPSGALVRGVTYTATFSTAGNLDSCVIEEVVTGAASVNELEPDAGPVTGTVSVHQTPMSCAALERARFSVAFGSAAPDGAAVTIRCYDTYSRVVSGTFTVQPLPPPTTP